MDAICGAVLMACAAHAGQYRSSNGQPFVTHPLQVARAVEALGFDMDTVLAAVLHDWPEDGDQPPAVSLNQISLVHGSRVADMVAALTYDPLIGDRAARVADLHKRLLRQLPRLGKGLAAVKLADRAHNSATAKHLSAERIQRMADENISFVAPLADAVGASGLARYLAAGPQSWWTIEPAGFVSGVLRVQNAWA